MKKPSTTPCVLLWLRNTFRWQDNPALQRAVALAVQQKLPLRLLVLETPQEAAPWARGGANRWWLHQTLLSFLQDLETRGGLPASSVVCLLAETAMAGLEQVSEQLGGFPSHLVCDARNEPWARRQEALMAEAQTQRGWVFEAINTQWLVHPSHPLTLQQTPYQVFTPYWKRLAALLAASPLSDAPLSEAPWEGLKTCLEPWPQPSPLQALSLDPRHGWTRSLAAQWQAGETLAQQHLEAFVKQQAQQPYAIARDIPSAAGTARLSPYLQLGSLSPWRVWEAVQRSLPEAAALPFLRQLGWREFASHLLWHYPHTAEAPLNARFASLPNLPASATVSAQWQQGHTGIPWVDAGMRELWHTGWMHNRVRMSVATLWVKHLGQPWQSGAAWFWETLIDADLAQNTLGWQWVAGCGADAAPYFRILNPQLQAQRFDSEARYIQHWIPELATQTPKAVLHWCDAPKPTPSLFKAVSEYPTPCVDLPTARDACLARYHTFKGSTD